MASPHKARYFRALWRTRGEARAFSDEDHSGGQGSMRTLSVPGRAAWAKAAGASASG